MTKNFASIIVLVLLISCHVDKVSIIEKIVDKGNYTIEIGFVGDFGSGTETIEITKDGLNSQATYTYLDYSRPDGPHKKKKSIIWGREKDKQVKQIFLTGITLKDTLLHCTMLASYRLKDFPDNVTFDDPSCVITEKFEALLK